MPLRAQGMPDLSSEDGRSLAAGEEGAPWRALILFAGPGDRPDSLARYMTSLGWDVTAIDSKIGGRAHDVTQPEVRQALLAQARAGHFHLVFAAPPCKSFSVAHRPTLRSEDHPEGLPLVPSEWREFLARHSGMANFTFDIVGAVEAAGGVGVVENPAARNGPPIGDQRAFWRRHQHHGSVWHTQKAKASGLIRLTFAQCAFGAPVQKWTTFGISAALVPAFQSISERGCSHGMGPHPQQAHGLDQDGKARSAAAAAYPTQLNIFIAAACTVGHAMRRNAGQQIAPQPGGRIGHGITLTPEVDAAIEARRLTAARFASQRSRIPQERSELRYEALPGDLHRSMEVAPNRAKPTLKRGRALPTENSASASMPSGDGDTPPRPAGAISVQQLFLPGIYQVHVERFFTQAQAAAAALKAGQPVPKVDTVVLPQETMPTWARGVVWDCRLPFDCRPVERSTRHTIFQGARQLDRQAIRHLAASMEWTDHDILSQVGEGGVETRSECALTTVLSWHHRGVEQHSEAAEQVILSDIAEKWVEGPFAWLPMVPCRALPRNVIMQPRTRLLPSGELEHYEKPRVSQDSSDGAEQSVNGGVPRGESGIELPSVQQFGRGVAIVEEAATPIENNSGAGSSRDPPELHAEEYCVDATSAFRFCPLQRAEWWTQCFFFWVMGPNGEMSVGMCIDTRMAFGGAYSPNRFERISRMIAAAIQRRQARFDAAQPVPEYVLQWQREREARQQAGLLPTGDAQRSPRYLQVFVDDWAGAALNDAVRVPQALQHIRIPPEATVAAGGHPSASDSRVRVHAMIAIDQLRRVGLEDAGSKTLLGDPVIALGIRVSRAARRMDVPDGKRAAMLDDVRRAREELQEQPPRVDVERALRLTGRASNLSQVLPELIDTIHGGYRVANSPWARREAGRPKGTLTLRSHSYAWERWCEMLDGTEAALQANVGVELAAKRVCGARDASGSITCVTDASGYDGVGGYVFTADDPSRVWIVSESWPQDIKIALAQAAMPRAERTSTATLAMPAAELFGAWAIAAEAARDMQLLSMPVERVFAVGDCAPAASVLHLQRSTNPIMRETLRGALQLTREWVAVAIPREQNLDPDRLSHPEQYEQVAREAEAAGLRITKLCISEDSWQRLRDAVTAAQRA